MMNKEGNKIDFDLSVLSFFDLIKVYEDIVNFLEFLEEKKIVEEEKLTDEN